MNYIVMVRYIGLRDQVWKTVQRDFDTIEAAENYARETRKTEGQKNRLEILIYELCRYE